MNVRHDPIRSVYPLSSRTINSLMDSAYADCINIAGMHHPSGDYNGLLDIIDKQLDLDASGLYNAHTTSIPPILQLDAEMIHIKEG
jgi:hypothetical protein